MAFVMLTLEPSASSQGAGTTARAELVGRELLPSSSFVREWDQVDAGVSYVVLRDPPESAVVEHVVDQAGFRLLHAQRVVLVSDDPTEDADLELFLPAVLPRAIAVTSVVGPEVSVYACCGGILAHDAGCRLRPRA